MNLTKIGNEMDGCLMFDHGEVLDQAPLLFLKTVMQDLLAGFIGMIKYAPSTIFQEWFCVTLKRRR